MKLGNPFSGAQLLRFGVVATLATGVLATAAGRGTLAYFTASTTSTANAFTAGTLRMNIADVNESPAATVGSSITFSGMKPGDIVYAPIEIDNVGSLGGKYGIKYATAVTTGGDVDLADGLSLAVKASGIGTGTRGTTALDGANACNAANWGTLGVWHDTVQADGTAMVSGVGPTSVLAVASGRPLAATSGVETLCLKVTFAEPGTGSNTYNTAALGHTNTTVTFTFDGLVSASAVTNEP